MMLTKASKKAITFACKNYHYSHSVPANYHAYNVMNDKNEWCGVIVFSFGANNCIGKPFGLAQGECIELTRVALNGKQECTSQALAMSIKLVHKDCPCVKLIVSYADCDRAHLGTIYQATNWIYVGERLHNSHDGSFIIHGKRYHGRTIYDIVKRLGGLPQGMSIEQFIQQRIDCNAVKYVTKGKRKYIMPLDKRTREQFAHLAQPYPKTDADWLKIDRNQFKKA